LGLAPTVPQTCPPYQRPGVLPQCLTPPMVQEKDYASFSSLSWLNCGDHRWKWKCYLVRGLGVGPTGMGGRWYARNLETRERVGSGHGFASIFDAEAACECQELANQPPEFPERDLERLLLHLSVRPRGFEQLAQDTRLSEGALSDAIARALELNQLRIVSWQGQNYYRTKENNNMVTATQTATQPTGTASHEAELQATVEDIKTLSERKVILEKVIKAEKARDEAVLELENWRKKKAAAPVKK
jgi:hypothetical protein